MSLLFWQWKITSLLLVKKRIIVFLIGYTICEVHCQNLIESKLLMDVKLSYVFGKAYAQLQAAHMPIA